MALANFGIGIRGRRLAESLMGGKPDSTCKNLSPSAPLHTTLAKRTTAVHEMMAGESGGSRKYWSSRVNANAWRERVKEGTQSSQKEEEKKLHGESGPRWFGREATRERGRMEDGQGCRPENIRLEREEGADEWI